VIQIETEVWNIKSKLDLGKEWGDVFGFFWGGGVKIFLVKMCYYLRGSADKSLARPGRKTNYSDQTRDLFNILPTKLNTLLSPLL